MLRLEAELAEATTQASGAAAAAALLSAQETAAAAGARANTLSSQLSELHASSALKLRAAYERIAGLETTVAAAEDRAAGASRELGDFQDQVERRLARETECASALAAALAISAGKTATAEDRAAAAEAAAASERARAVELSLKLEAAERELYAAKHPLPSLAALRGSGKFSMPVDPASPKKTCSAASGEEPLFPPDPASPTFLRSPDTEERRLLRTASPVAAMQDDPIQPPMVEPEPELEPELAPQPERRGENIM